MPDPSPLPSHTNLEVNPDVALTSPLRSAYKRLLSALGEAIETYDRTVTSRFPNPTPVVDAIEQFVYELHQVPTYFAELERRAHFVEAATGPASGYELAKRSALSKCKSRPKKLCAGKLALQCLRNEPSSSPQFVSVVSDIRGYVETVLHDPSLRLSAGTREAFEVWKNACRKIQLETSPLHVDGCRNLYYAYRAAEPNPSDHSKWTSAILKSSVFGGALLDGMKAAAESLVVRIAEKPASRRVPRKKKRRQPPPIVRSGAPITTEAKAQFAIKRRRAKSQPTWATVVLEWNQAHPDDTVDVSSLRGAVRRLRSV